MSSAEVADVTAKKSRINKAAAPDLPSRAAAAAAAGKPADTSAGAKGRMSGSPRKATAARPRVVAMVNGIANLHDMSSKQNNVRGP
jgi:hypothetical protein